MEPAQRNGRQRAICFEFDHIVSPASYSSVSPHCARTLTTVHTDLRFRGQFCYIDAFVDDDVSPGTDPAQAERILNTPMQLCRMRFFGEDRWSLAFFKYSDMKYEPCFFDTGEWIGTPEQALDVGGVYLR